MLDLLGDRRSATNPEPGDGDPRLDRQGVLVDRLDAEEAVFDLANLQAASEAFLASTGREAQPIARVGETVLPAAPGPITLEAQRALRRAVQDDTSAWP